MRDVQMQKNDLIQRVTDNLDRHKEMYEAALEAFKVRRIEVIEGLLEDAKAFREVDQYKLVRLPVPETHEDDYEVALKMLELEEREVVTLTQNEFRQYYLDEWGWQASFTANTGSYLAS